MFLPPVPMPIRMVVATDSDGTSTSTHFTSTPFRPSLTGLIVIIDISGVLSWAEILEEVNLVELAVTGGGTPLGPFDVTMGMTLNGIAGSLSRITVNSHLKNDPVTLHVRSS